MTYLWLLVYVVAYLAMWFALALLLVPLLPLLFGPRENDDE